MNRVPSGCTVGFFSREYLVQTTPARPGEPRSPQVPYLLAVLASASFLTSALCGGCGAQVGLLAIWIDATVDAHRPHWTFAEAKHAERGALAAMCS